MRGYIKNTQLDDLKTDRAGHPDFKKAIGSGHLQVRYSQIQGGRRESGVVQGAGWWEEGRLRVIGLAYKYV